MTRRLGQIQIRREQHRIRGKTHGQMERIQGPQRSMYPARDRL
jgi:hypothetical protein